MGGALSAVYLHTSGLAWEFLSEKNKMVFANSLEESLPESFCAGLDEDTRLCLGCGCVTRVLYSSLVPREASPR